MGLTTGMAVPYKLLGCKPERNSAIYTFAGLKLDRDSLMRANRSDFGKLDHISSSRRSGNLHTYRDLRGRPMNASNTGTEPSDVPLAWSGPNNRFSRVTTDNYDWLFFLERRPVHENAIRTTIALSQPRAMGYFVPYSRVRCPTAKEHEAARDIEI